MICAVLTHKAAIGWHLSEFIFDTHCFYFRGFKNKIAYEIQRKSVSSGPVATSPQFQAIREMR